MIVRIVSMTFKKENVELFLNIFNSNIENIAGFKGCLSVKLLQDSDNKNRFFTISEWAKAEDLQSYRESELFKNTWNKTKTLFEDKPFAWSTSILGKYDTKK